MNLKKLLILAGATVFLVILTFLGPFRFFENIFYDLNFTFSPARTVDSVAVVAIDMRSIGEIGAWPWPRRTLARLVESVESCDPRTIALDFLFPVREGAADNDSLAAVFSRVSKLVLPFRAGGIAERQSGGMAQIPRDILKHRFVRLNRQEKLGRTFFYSVTEFGAADTAFSRHAAYGGFLNVSTSSTSRTLREVIHVIKSGDEYFPSFGLSAVAAYYGLKPSEIVLDGAPAVVLGDRRTVPLTTYAATSFVNYRRGEKALDTWSAADVMSPSFDRRALAGKLVFIGITDPAAGAADFFITPIRSQYPGVEVWATAALDIMEKSWVRRGGGVAAVFNWALLFALFPGLAIFVPFRRKSFALAGSLGAVVLSVALGLKLFDAFHYFWNPAPHIYAVLFYLLWIAAQKADPSLAAGAALELDIPPGEDDDDLPPPRKKDFITDVPSTATARSVLDKIALSSLQMPRTDAAHTETVYGTVVESPIEEIRLGEAVKPSAAAPASGVSEEVFDKVSSLSGGKIVRVLGSGGMADVYLVWNPRLEVYRAIKVIKPDQPSSLLARFETEIRIVSKLNHPNIVLCYGVGDWHGLPCIEMEYVNGLSMEDVVEKRGCLTPPQAFAVGICMCRALHYAHNLVITLYGETYRGVVHRDIKPANVMISRGGRVKLTDFGIARPGSVSLHTMDSGSVVGTLPYLAPEQLDGAELSVKTDIYALGATLYEFMAGRRAFAQTEVSSLVKAKTMGTIAPLSSSGTLPRELVDTINRALSVNPRQRYESAGAMEDDLAAGLKKYTKEKAYVYLRQIAGAGAGS